MQTYPNGTRYNYTRDYDETLHQPYDYQRNGLLQHTMSQRIVNTPNEITQFIYRVFEKSITLCLKLTEVLQNYKNPFFRNR